MCTLGDPMSPRHPVTNRLTNTFTCKDKWRACATETEQGKQRESTRTRTRERECAREKERARAKEHARTHARTHTHTHARTHTYVRTNTHTHARKHARTHAWLHARTHTHLQIEIRKRKIRNRRHKTERYVVLEGLEERCGAALKRAWLHLC